MMQHSSVDHGACKPHGACHHSLKLDGTMPSAHINVRTAEATPARQALFDHQGSGGTIKSTMPCDLKESHSPSPNKFQYAHLDYTCFLCGRGFGCRSLGIHVSQCLKKWTATEAQLPPDEQRSHPYLPTEMTDPTSPGKLRTFKDGVAEGVLPVNQLEFEAFNRAMAQSARKNAQHAQGSVCASAAGHPAALGSRSFPVRDDSSSDSAMKKEGGALSWLAKLAFGGTMMPSFVKRSHDGGDDCSASTEKIPMAYACYLCGQQFGAKSLMTHLHHCNRQRELQNLKLRHPRPPLPLPPKRLADPNNPMGLVLSNEDGSLPDGVLPTNEADVRAFNIAMTEYWRAGLPRCLHCKTVFLPEQLPEHQPSCAADHSANSTQMSVHQQQPPQLKQGHAKVAHVHVTPASYSSSNATQSKQQTRPSSRNSRIVQAQAILNTGGFRHYRCYLCERKFPGTAIKAHCMDCKRKWVKSEEILPEGMRRLLPPPPPEMRLVLAGQAELPVDPSDVAAFNAAMAAHWESTSLMKCPACTGCFRPKQYMEHHHRKCQPDDNLPEDTTISLGSAVSSVLTPPITQDHGRPMLVPELSLGAQLASNGKSKRPAAAAAAKGKTPTKSQLKEQQHKAHPLKHHGQGQAGSVKSTLMQAAAALESVDAKLSKPSYKEQMKQTKAQAASSGPSRPSKASAAPARTKPKGGKASSVGNSKPTSASRASSMMYTCYLCGAEQRYHGYHIHIGQCCRKWQNLQRTLSKPVPLPPNPGRLQRNVPLPTGPKEVAEFNHEMQLHREKYAINHCGSCSKDISVLAWERHRAKCRPTTSKSKQQASGSSKCDGGTSAAAAAAAAAAAVSPGLQTKGRTAANGRLSYACYVCANEFNASKYHAHVEACRRKFEEEDAAAREALPSVFKTTCKLPSPDQKRLPVEPAQVELFNQRMLETFETLQMSKKLSLPSDDEPVIVHGNYQEMSADTAAKDVLGEFMGQRGKDIGIHADHHPHRSSKTSTSASTPRREPDNYELFTPLPTGPGMQKGEVMVSCRHCGKAVSETELFAHAHQCAGGDCPMKNCSQPGTQRSHGRNSHRTARSHYAGEMILRAGSHCDSHRVTTDEVPAFVSPPTPTISETQYLEDMAAAARAADISPVEPEGRRNFAKALKVKWAKAKRKVSKRAKSLGVKMKRSITGAWSRSVRGLRTLKRAQV